MNNFNVNDFKILKYIYKLNYDDFEEHLKNNLKVIDGVKLLELHKTLPAISSPNKESRNWDMVLIDKANSDSVEFIFYKSDIEFTLVDMTKYYKDGSSILPEKFIKNIDDFLKTQMNLDDILDKIHIHGVGKLNKFEKNFLDGFKG